jgi:hypothetical protein
MRSLLVGRGLTAMASVLAVAGAACSGRALSPTGPVDASDTGLPNVGDGAASPLCQLTAVTDIVPATSEIEPYAGLLSGTTSLFVIHPEDRRLSRVPVNGGALEPIADYALHALRYTPPFLVGADTNGVVKVSADGATARRLVDGHAATAIATDGPFVWWVEPAAGGGSEIWRVDSDGANPHRLLTRSEVVGWLGDADGALVWIERASDGTVFSVVTAGADGSTVGLPVPMTGSPAAAVVAGTYGVFVSVGTDILHVPMGASQATVLARDQPMVTSISVGWDRVYWTRNVDCVTDPNVGNGTTVCGGVVSSVAIAGGPPVDLPGSDNARTVAADQHCVYWTTTAGQFHVAAPVGIRGAPVTLAR